MMATSWWDSPSSTPAHADIPYEAGDLPGADEDRRLGRCEKIAALPPAVRKGSALPDLRFKIKLFGFSRLPESRRLSAQQAAEPQNPAASDFLTPSLPRLRYQRPFSEPGPDQHHQHAVGGHAERRPGNGSSAQRSQLGAVAADVAGS